jgi:hypothetical protein
MSEMDLDHSYRTLCSQVEALVRRSFIWWDDLLVQDTYPKIKTRLVFIALRYHTHQYGYVAVKCICMCMCVCICMCLYVCVCVYMCVCAYMCVFVGSGNTYFWTGSKWCLVCAPLGNLEQIW